MNTHTHTHAHTHAHTHTREFTTVKTGSTQILPMATTDRIGLRNVHTAQPNEVSQI